MTLDGARQADHDAGENDQRHTVADTAIGDLLTQPHDEGRSGREGQNRQHDEAETRIQDEIAF